jgi:hypothetical protein
MVYKKKSNKAKTSSILLDRCPQQQHFASGLLSRKDKLHNLLVNQSQVEWIAEFRKI